LSKIASFDVASVVCKALAAGYQRRALLRVFLTDPPAAPEVPEDGEAGGVLRTGTRPPMKTLLLRLLLLLPLLLLLRLLHLHHLLLLVLLLLLLPLFLLLPYILRVSSCPSSSTSSSTSSSSTRLYERSPRS
jgi:hypothetical protein